MIVHSYLVATVSKLSYRHCKAREHQADECTNTSDHKGNTVSLVLTEMNRAGAQWLVLSGNLRKNKQ